MNFWGGKFCVGHLGERHPQKVPGILYIFTYFTRYLKSHFQTQLLKSDLQRSIQTPYKEDNCLFHDDIPLTAPSRQGSNDVRTLGDRGNIMEMDSDDNDNDDMVDDDEVESHNNDYDDDKEDTSMDIYHPSKQQYYFGPGAAV